MSYLKTGDFICAAKKKQTKQRNKQNTTTAKKKKKLDQLVEATWDQTTLGRKPVFLVFLIVNVYII